MVVEKAGSNGGMSVACYTSENNIILFVCPPKFCISIVSRFSWDLQWSQEKIKTILMQNLGGQIKSIMVLSEVAYWTTNRHFKV